MDAVIDMLEQDYVVEGEGANAVVYPPAVLTGRDLTLFAVLTVIPATTIMNLQFVGPLVFFYLLLGFVLFAVPRSIVIEWLYTRFSAYQTMYHIIASLRGRTTAFFGAFCIWWPGVLLAIFVVKEVLGLSHSLFLSSGNGTMMGLVLPGLTTLLLFGAAMLVACLPMRSLRTILFTLILPYFMLFPLLGVIGLFWMVSGHQAHLLTVQAWMSGIHSISMNATTLCTVMFSQISMIVPLYLNGELRRSTPTQVVQRWHHRNFLWWSGLITMLLLASGSFGVMAIVPPQLMGHASPVLLAIHIALGPVPASILTTLYALGQLLTIVVILVLYSRIMLVMAQENRLPLQLARLNRFGVPVKSIVTQTIITASLALLFFVINPYLVSRIPQGVAEALHIGNDLSMNIYIVVLAAASILFTVASSFMFMMTLQMVRQQRRKQDQVQTPRHVRLFVSLMAFSCLVTTIVCVLLALMHPWVPTYPPGPSWVLVIVGIIGSFILLGWLVSAFPRIQAALEEQRIVNVRESRLRTQLEESYEQQKTLLEEVAQLYREHAQAAITDAITGLPNHRAVMSTFDDVLDQSRRQHCSCAVLFIDLDHFKRVNDTWGHRAGDAILQQVAQRLRDTLRDEDFVGRYGGEEFAILLRETDIDEASHVGERLREAVCKMPCCYQPEDEQEAIEIAMTTSIGVALYQLHGTTRESLITSADNAMYRAKRTGRNRVCIADVELDAVSMTPSQQVKTTSALETAQTTHAIHALTAAASARDGDTHDHANRMVELAEATARRLNCVGEEIRLIRLAALLHDIGKIGIPDAILHKPGPLTNEEWSVMRSHPEIGRNILERTGGVLRSLANVVAAHHERWDGSGYPLGLKGEDIPLGARILSVVDSYDAMTARRVYREPRSLEEARAELQHCAGSQFDPCVVAAFFAALDTHGQFVDAPEEPVLSEGNMDAVSA